MHVAQQHTIHTPGVKQSQNTSSEGSQILRSTYCASSFLGSLWRGKNSLAWGSTLRKGGRKYMKGSPQGTFWVIRFSTLIGVWITWGHAYIRTYGLELHQYLCCWVSVLQRPTWYRFGAQAMVLMESGGAFKRWGLVGRFRSLGAYPLKKTLGLQSFSLFAF